MNNYLKWQKFFIFACMLIFAFVLLFGFVTSLSDTHHLIWILQSSIGLIFLTIPLLINKAGKIKISFTAYFAFAIIVMLTILLGFTFKFYETFTWYDIVTHSLSHLLLTLLGITLINAIFNLKGNFNSFTIVLFGIAFALACGFVWELIEFSLDSCLGLNMQRFIPEDTALYNGGNSFNELNGSESEIANFFKVPNGYRFALLDTMYDLFVDFIGAIIGGVAFMLLKRRGKAAVYNSIALCTNESSVVYNYNNV